jgi:hypothetical protein
MGGQSYPPILIWVLHSRKGKIQEQNQPQRRRTGVSAPHKI